MQEKIGVFGGTFNPVHVGHLIAAERIRETFSLSRVIFVPSASPPHKLTSDVIETHHRYAMLHLAALGNKGFDISDVEILRGGPSYTVDTIQHFKQVYSPTSEFYFLIGVDAFMEIHTWKEGTNLLHLCNFIVITRRPVLMGDGQEYVKRLGGFELCDPKCFSPIVSAMFTSSPSRTSIYFVDTPLIDISSNYIRKALQCNRSIRYMVPDAVLRYIKKENLYSKIWKLI